MKNLFSMFVGLLKIGEKPVETIAAAYNPFVGVLVTSVLNGIFHAEAVHGKGAGKTKAEQVLGAVGVFSPIIGALVEKSTGRAVNGELLADGIGDLNSALVKILNATGGLPKETSTLANASPDVVLQLQAMKAQAEAMRKAKGEADLAELRKGL